MFSCKNASTAERLFSSLRTRWECLWTRRVTLGLSVLPCNRCRSVGGDGACLSSMVWVSFQSYETIFSFAFGFGVFFLLQAPSGSRPMTRRSSVASSTSGPPPLPTSLPPHTPRALPPVLPPPRQRQTLPHSAGTGSFPTSPSSPSSPGFALPVPRPLPADTPPELPWRPSHAQPATTEVREVPQFRRQPMDMYMPGGVFGADPPEHLLRKAAKAGNQRRVRELLETHRGVRVNAIPVNGSGKTALYLAAERGHVEVRTQDGWQTGLTHCWLFEVRRAGRSKQTHVPHAPLRCTRLSISCWTTVQTLRNATTTASRLCKQHRRTTSSWL
eukprot:m.210803 g.210803  ORF g.210803 m.210803 type:complete len:329 (+) comp18567_c0_seq7:1686-2672(+)